jgi:hypothetical protein
MVVSTLNPDEVPAARLRIIEEGEEPSAALVEKQRAGTEFQRRMLRRRLLPMIGLV